MDRWVRVVLQDRQTERERFRENRENNGDDV